MEPVTARRVSQDNHLLRTKSDLSAKRSDTIFKLVQKRKSNFDYLVRTLNSKDGGFYWFNCVKIDRPDLEKYFPREQMERQTREYYHLGLSFGKILELPTGPCTAKACVQLLEEFSFHFSNSNLQKMKLLRARQGEYFMGMQKGNTDAIIDSPEAFRPCIHRMGNKPVYMHLLTPNIPVILDFFEVTVSLCETLVQVYDKLVDSGVWERSYIYDAVKQFDKRLNNSVVNLMSKRLLKLSIELFREQMKAMVFGAGEDYLGIGDGHDDDDDDDENPEGGAVQ